MGHQVVECIWTYPTTYKVTTKCTPFWLVYDQPSILLVESELPSLRIAIDERLSDEESLQEIIAILERLDKICR